MTEPLPHPQEVLDKFLFRDRTAVDDYNNYYSRGGIESKVQFTSDRAQDTASMVVYILKYLAQHKPLTNEEIDYIAVKSQQGLSPHDDTLRFARAIEAAHNIKENT